MSAADVAVSFGTLAVILAIVFALTNGRRGLRAARALMRRHITVYWSYKFAVVSVLGNLALVGFLVLIIGRELLPLFVPILPEELEGDASFNYAAFLITGFMAWPLIWSGYNIASRNIRIEQYLGMFETLLPTAMGVRTLPFAYLALSAFTATLTGSLSLAFFAYFFDLPLHLDSLALVASLIAVLGCSVFMAWGMGLAIGGLTVIVRETEPFSAGIRLVMLAFSGVILPVEVFPAGFRWFAELLPLTHSFRALRLVLLQGQTVTDFLPVFLDLAFFSLLLALAGIKLFDLCIDRARKFGTLGGY